MPPFIPYPNVPEAPGVPQILRPISGTIASNPVLATTLGTIQNLLAQAIAQGTRWGIFDVDGAQLGLKSGSGSQFVDLAFSQITGQKRTQLTTLRFDFQKSARVSSFPVEGGSFATFNKVVNPYDPVVTLCLQGSEDERTYFLNSIDRATESTVLYNVVTPEKRYLGCTLTGYRYARAADRGATLLVVEVALEEVRQVTATFGQSIVTPSPAQAQPQVDAGKVQAAPPSDTSVLKQGVDAIRKRLGLE